MICVGASMESWHNYSLCRLNVVMPKVILVNRSTEVIYLKASRWILEVVVLTNACKLPAFGDLPKQRGITRTGDHLNLASGKSNVSWIVDEADEDLNLRETYQGQRFCKAGRCFEDVLL